jgi:TetR/AcrR family transcriptional regulator, mexJK operon transcriptional repressor
MAPTGTRIITGRSGRAGAGAAAPRGRGGRPSLSAAAQLGDAILVAATDLFLRYGYAVTSIEAVAKAAGVSKRTLYARFDDKAALLQHAVARLIAGWRAPYEAGLDHPMTLQEMLEHAARHMLRAALAPEALALYRLVVSESGRVPDLGAALNRAGARGVMSDVAAALRAAGIADPDYAAEQFQHLVLAGPQRRALGLGRPLDEAERETWAKAAVRLFLHGARA